MHVTVLGGCGAWPERGRPCSGYLVEHQGFSLLVDPGYATFSALLEHAAGAAIDAVHVTHGHPDHCVDLNPLLRARVLSEEGLPPLPVYAPRGALDAVLALDRPGMLADGYTLHELDGGEQLRLGPFAAETRQLPHMLPNLGLRLEADGSVLAYTGDTGPSPEVGRLAEDADLLLAEATYADEVPADSRAHLSSAAVAGDHAVAARARRLLLSTSSRAPIRRPRWPPRGAVARRRFWSRCRVSCCRCDGLVPRLRQADTGEKGLGRALSRGREMTAVDTLVPGMSETHRVLDERLARAAAARPDVRHVRDQYPAIDTFLASASRHHGAVLEVLVPAVRRRLPDGDERAAEFVHQCKELEVALTQVKAKLYGSTYAIRRTWDSIWDDVRAEFDRTWVLERELVNTVAATRHDDDPDWGERLYHAELHAPTRPHPYVWHRGLRGRVARTVALRIDRFWDTAEGRMIPEPVKAHDRGHDGKVTQYLLADPHLEDEEE